MLALSLWMPIPGGQRAKQSLVAAPAAAAQRSCATGPATVSTQRQTVVANSGAAEVDRGPEATHSVAKTVEGSVANFVAKSRVNYGFPPASFAEATVRGIAEAA